jgi:biotin transport system substrate-specific component
LPLLAGGRGGLAVFQGPSAGFVIAFPFAAALTGLIVERLWERLTFVRCLIATIVGGIGVVYLIGIPMLSFIAGLSLPDAAMGAGIFIPGDLIKAALAASIAMFVKRGYPVISSRNRSV